MTSFLRKSHTKAGILLLAALLSACGSALGNAFPEAEIARQESQTASAAGVSAETGNQLAGADLSAQPLPAIKIGSSDFHASDPASVKLDSGKVQFVEFFAYWCAVCKAMAPTVHGLENLYGDQIDFIYLDRDDPATFGLQEQLGYIYQPHFFLLDPHGVILAQWRGYVDGIELQRALAGSLGE
jgi:thiol-disulfide isomerase/thioredoxin